MGSRDKEQGSAHGGERAAPAGPRPAPPGIGMSGRTLRAFARLACTKKFSVVTAKPDQRLGSKASVGGASVRDRIAAGAMPLSSRCLRRLTTEHMPAREPPSGDGEGEGEGEGGRGGEGKRRPGGRHPAASIGPAILRRIGKRGKQRKLSFKDWKALFGAGPDAGPAGADAPGASGASGTSRATGRWAPPAWLVREGALEERGAWRCAVHGGVCRAGGLTCDRRRCRGLSPLHPFVRSSFAAHGAAYADAAESTAALCGVCFCDGATGSVCEDAQAGCDKRFCRDCLERYFTLTVEGAVLAAPAMRCPGRACRRRIPTARWKPLVPASVRQVYVANALALLNIRCLVCDRVETLLPLGSVPADQREQTLKRLLPKQKRGVAAAAILRAWRRFRDGVAGAADLVGAMEEHSFFRRDGPQERFARMACFLELVDDLERRATLLLAFLDAFPFVSPTCHDNVYCFKCKTPGTHDEPCEERLRFIADDLRLCPSCKLPSPRSGDGATVICRCGHRWAWDEGGAFCGESDDESDGGRDG